MFGPHHFDSKRHNRFFERGDLKYIILDLLKDKPSHGYEIIRALEERSHGFYSPSAGSVYPTLQLLEDMGYVSYSEQDGKKTYSITDAGGEFLNERSQNITKIRDHMRDFWTPGNREEIRETMGEFRMLARSLRQDFYKLDHEKLVQIKEIIAGARKEIEAIIEK